MNVSDILREALAAYTTGRFPDAERLCRLMAVAEPGLAHAVHLHGVLTALAADEERAATFFRRSVLLNPKDAQCAMNFAQLLIKRNRIEDAIDLLFDVLTRHVFDEKLAAFLTEVTAKTGNEARVVGLYRKAFGPCRYGDVERLFRGFTGLNIREALTLEETAALHGLADRAARANAVFVEVGSWLGMSTAVLGDVAKAVGGRVFAIDTWQGSPSTWHDEEVLGFNILISFCKNMEHFGLFRDVVIPIVTKSEKSYDVFGAKSLDLVFIDGDHRYEAIRADLSFWLPRVKSGGILCGHDCERIYQDLSPEHRALVEQSLDLDYQPEIGHPGVIKAVHEMFGSNINRAGRSLWWTVVP